MQEIDVQLVFTASLKLYCCGVMRMWAREPDLPVSVKTQLFKDIRHKWYGERW